MVREEREREWKERGGSGVGDGGKQNQAQFLRVVCRQQHTRTDRLGGKRAQLQNDAVHQRLPYRPVVWKQRLRLCWAPSSTLPVTHSTARPGEEKNTKTGARARE